MKLLIQHRHYSHEISGVLTYVHAVIPELEKANIQVQTISTRQDNLWQWIAGIFWSDIVHMNSNDLGFALLCKLFGKKIIIKYHFPLYFCTHSKYEPKTFGERFKQELKTIYPPANYPWKWKFFALVKLARLLTRIGTAFLADSHTACSNFLGESCSFPWLVKTIYNPIDISEYQQPKNLEHLSEEKKLIFVGRLDADKGVDILLKAVKLLNEEQKKFQLVIIGDGPQAGELKQLAQSLEINDYVQFLGKLPHTEVLNHVKNALALVAPSRWQDPAPYTVLEASSVQTCTIVSQMGGLPEVGGPHSLSFKNGDIRELANCLKFCIESPEETLKRGWLSSQYVAEKFAPHIVARELIELCNCG
ncbi:glycosyltransferase family 4 protein [Calothrix sp. 336/3]|uniref:glycosyltransferase family 4 protein n=1 Tax=Calothrix sp. 336/3 TaxID=1337936 RepID=UPI0004E4140B|nr:glycosyltransferase family 4 protein [Calothrix sp. 336/3]AKG22537.1 glycosyltransferase [Calothrix sp. 336/3]